MNPGCRVKDQLNTSEPTAPYIIGRELNLRKLLGRQWESNPQPSEQLRPMTIKTSASTEMGTTAYIHIEEFLDSIYSKTTDITRKIIFFSYFRNVVIRWQISKSISRPPHAFFC